jgi:hypothetical protein
VGTWEADDPAYSRPIAAPLKCAELLGVDLATIQDAVTHIRPYVQVDGTKVWSLMQLERHLRPQAYGRVRGAISPVAGSEPLTGERHDRQMFSSPIQASAPLPRLRCLDSVLCSLGSCRLEQLDRFDSCLGIIH